MTPVKLSEKKFQAMVVKLAVKTFGWTAYHTHNSRRSAKGFPDLVLVKPGRRVVYAELKTDTGETTPEQDVWLALLRRTDARVFLWRPSDLNEIAAVLGSGPEISVA